MKLVALTLTCIALVVGAGTSRADTGKSKSHHVTIQTKVFKKNLHKSQTVVNWWNHRGHWALFPRHPSCSDLMLKTRAVCMHARRSLEDNQARISRLTALLAPPPPPAPVYGMMNPICGSSCISCESGWNPMAVNPAGYWGLYQFDYGTWKAHGGDPAMYGKASASEQHRVASHITYDAWPNC